MIVVFGQVGTSTRMEKRLADDLPCSLCHNIGSLACLPSGKASLQIIWVYFKVILRDSKEGTPSGAARCRKPHSAVMEISLCTEMLVDWTHQCSIARSRRAKSASDRAVRTKPDRRYRSTHRASEELCRGTPLRSLEYSLRNWRDRRSEFPAAKTGPKVFGHGAFRSLPSE